MAWYHTSCDDIRASLSHQSDRSLEIAATVLRQEGVRKTALALIERELAKRARKHAKEGSTR